jgi:2-polyprenyl-3-methyl-5-hydroxy-6-metoxy-1,4-benzoquinol methylase
MNVDGNRAGEATAGREYAQRMTRLRFARWKQALHVQAPYGWNLRRLHLGRTLDVGCGIGRNLEHLGADAVGVDHNASCIAIARSRGLTAYTTETFADCPDAALRSYDALLFAHVLEHLEQENAIGLVKEYLPFLKPGGQVVIITPQERGFGADATHTTFIDFELQRRIAATAGLRITRQYSFPLPRLAGRLFVYNEFVAVARYASPTSRSARQAPGGERLGRDVRSHAFEGN